MVAAEGIVYSSIRFWEVATGKEIRPPLTDHRMGVGDLLFFPDGKTMASASADQTIRWWDVSDVTQVRPWGRPLRGHTLEVHRLALLPDNRTLASGSKDGSVCLWDAAALREERTEMTLPVQVASWCFAPDSKSVLAFDEYGRVARWQGSRFQEMTPIFDTFLTNWTSPSRFLDQGRKLMIDQESAFSTFVGTPSDADCMWDLTREREVHCWANPPNATGSAFSSDERWWVRLGHGGKCCIRDLGSGLETNPPLDILAAGWGPDISPDGKALAVPSWLGYVRLWETSTWREIKALRGILLGYQSATFSPDGTRLITGASGDEAIKLWDTESYEELLTLPGLGYCFNGTAFSPNGTVLGSKNVTGILHLWRAPSWAEIEAAEAQRPQGAQPR